jgi:hypothetical protein
MSVPARRQRAIVAALDHEHLSESVDGDRGLGLTGAARVVWPPWHGAISLPLTQ